MSEQNTPSLAERRAAIQKGLLEQTLMTTAPAPTKAARAAQAASDEATKAAAEPKAKPTPAAPKPGQAKEE